MTVSREGGGAEGAGAEKGQPAEAEGPGPGRRRVAVAEHKGVDPYRVVFLAMLSAEAFFENPEWRFDLAVGSLCDELETTVQDQISVEELGYEDDKGAVSGEDVIADIIERGSALAQERFRERQEAEQQAPMPDEQVITTSYW